MGGIGQDQRVWVDGWLDREIGEDIEGTGGQNTEASGLVGEQQYGQQ